MEVISIYDKAAVGILPVTGAGLLTGSLGLVLVAVALLGVGLALYRIAPRVRRGR